MPKSLIASLFLLVVTASAASQTTPGLQSPGSQYWRYVTSSKDRRVSFYAILKTSEGDIRELWEKAVDADYEGIVVTLKKYDCESGTSLLTHMTIYTGSEITLNESYNDTPWQYSKPNTVGNALLRAACGERKREWTYVGESTDDTAYFLKLGSLSKSSLTIRVWSKTVKKEETESMTLWEFDCVTGKLRSVQSTDYEDGAGFTTRGRTWKYAVPESMGESLLEAACKAHRNNVQHKNGGR